MVCYVCVYNFSYYRKFEINPKDYPNTNEVFSRIITLPLYPTMEKEDIDSVIRAVEESLKGA